MGGAHYGYDVVGGGLLVGIDDDGGLGILGLCYGAGYKWFQGIYYDGMCAYEKFLLVIYRYDHGLFGLGVAFGFWDAELYHVWIGKGGYDEEEQQQNEQYVIERR